MVDRHNNRIALEGLTRCQCGCKYWENDRCVDCGSTPIQAVPNVEQHGDHSTIIQVGQHSQVEVVNNGSYVWLQLTHSGKQVRVFLTVNESQALRQALELAEAAT